MGPPPTYIREAGGVRPHEVANSGHPAPIRELNAHIHGFGVPVLPFHDTLADPSEPTRMREGLTDDGDHPSIEGHRLLGEQAFRLDV